MERLKKYKIIAMNLFIALLLHQLYTYSTKDIYLFFSGAWVGISVYTLANTKNFE